MTRRYPDALRTKIELGEEEMSIDRAMEWIDNRMCMGRCRENLGCTRFNYFKDEPHIAGEMAIKALEKLVPKKPNNETYFTHYKHQKKCPVCGDWLILEGGTKMKYCCNCGQAIDWSED